MVVKYHSQPAPHIFNPQHRDYSLQYGDDQLKRRSPRYVASRWQHPPYQKVLAPDGPPKTPRRGDNVPNDLSRTRIRTNTMALMQIFFFLAMNYSIYSSNTELSNRNSKLENYRLELETVEDAMLHSKANNDSIDTYLANIQSQFIDLLPEGQEHSVGRGVEFKYEDVYQAIADKNNAMKEQVHDLRNIIADLHREEAIKHFGSYQHRLRFNLLIDDSVHSFTVEMAPLDAMPHSVNFFLNMVEAQEWDNAVFIHDSNHILRAELTDVRGHEKRRFNETLSFTEYHHDYPHNKYTLGFSGRPGGPEFYINTEDNREIHGPGGQAHNGFGAEADPCFARVIEGFSVVDWMLERSKSANKSNSASFTMIKSVKMISDELE